MTSPAYRKRYGVILLALVIGYAAFASFAITAWIETNLILSWLASVGAVLVAGAVAAVAGKMPRLKMPIEITAMVLAGPPLFFVLRGLALVFKLLSQVTYSH